MSVEFYDGAIPCAVETIDGVSRMKIGERLVDVHPNTGDEKLLENIRINSQRPLQPFAPAFCRNDGHMAIVGSGPSVAGFVDQIRSDQEAGRPVMAIKGAHDWLIEHGITPDLWCALDAQPKIVDGVKHKSKKVGYLLASKADPSVFDWLSDQQVVMWHPWLGIGEEKLLDPRGMRIGGGTSSGLRGIVLAYLMGFRKVILYGFDSCLAGDELRVGQGAVTEETHFLQVEKGGRKWKVNAAMASQAMEFNTIFQYLGDLRFRVMGEGPIADIVEDRKRRDVGGYF
jgi:hypothetical protein